MRGYRSCSVAIHREHEAKAMLAVQRHADRLVDGSVRFDGSRLHFAIDLARVPQGDAPSIECVIVRDVERAVKS